MLNSVYKTKAVRPLINYYSPDQFYNLLNLDSETLKDKSQVTIQNRNIALQPQYAYYNETF